MGTPSTITVSRLRGFRHIPFELGEEFRTRPLELRREVARFPFVPADPASSQ